MLRLLKMLIAVGLGVAIGIVPFWAVLWVFSGSETPGPGYPPLSLKSEVVASYVQISIPGEGTGAGVVVEVRGHKLILTCAHVVDGCRAEKDGITTVRPVELEKRHNQTALYKSLGDVVQMGQWEKGIDLALVRPRETKGLVPALWDVNLKTELGEDCWYIGTPSGVHGRLERSILALEDQVCNPLKGTFYGINGCAYFGSSGGAVFVRRGESYYLCGIVRGGGPDLIENPKAIGYAVDHKTVKKFLALYKG